VVITGIKVAIHVLKVSSQIVEFIHEVSLVEYQNTNIIKTKAYSSE
jgi:hypothetical protein